MEPVLAVRNPHRLAALRRTGLLDTPPEEEFDRLTRLAAEILEVPVAIVNLIEADWQFFKSCVGLGEPLATERGMPVEHSFCKHAVASGEPLVIPDTRSHPLHRTNPMITELGIIAYLGIPLISADGEALGTLCVIDGQPRPWTDRQVRILRDLAASVMTEIELGMALRENERLAEESRALALLRERERIAMDLHDGVIQSLYAVALGLSAQVRKLDKPSAELSTTLNHALGQITSTIQEIRNYIFNLQSHELGPHGLRRGLEMLATELRAHALIEAELNVASEAEVLLGSGVGTHLLAIAREATSNVIRHSGASAVAIRLGVQDGMMTLEIRDNGCGFDDTCSSTSVGNGLRNMAQRARLIGGRLTISSELGRGTEMRLLLPEPAGVAP